MRSANSKRTSMKRSASVNGNSLKRYAIGSDPLKATQALDLAVFETGMCDILVREKGDRRGRERLIRPWLTFLIDVYSGTVLGWDVQENPKSEASMLSCLARANHTCGLPSCIAIDNDLNSSARHHACDEAKISLIFFGRSYPVFSGLVERWFWSFNNGIAKTVRCIRIGELQTESKGPPHDWAVR